MARKPRPGSTSLAKAAAARRNGVKGGPHGVKGGRPRKPRWDYASAMARLPPDASLPEKLEAALETSLENVMASDMPDRERRQEIRAIAKVAGPTAPKARLIRAARLVRGERDDMAQTGKDPPLEPRPKKEPGATG